MNSGNSPLLSRLILLVLVLNLICLALLVIRSYQQPVPRAEPAVAPVAVAAPEPELEAAPPPPRPVAPRPPTARPVPSAPASPLTAEAARTEPAPPPPEPAVPVVPPPAPLVNLGETRTGRQSPTQGVTVPDHRRDLPELSGFVTLRGIPRPEIPIAFSPACGALHPRVLTTRHYVVSQDGGLANVLVYLQNAKPAPPLVEPPLLDQVGCMFEPYVMAVVAGQRFQVRNSDPMLHNLHFIPNIPKLNRERNIGQARKGQVDTFVLPQPELFVRIKCDVHPWMFAYVSSLEHPYFSITDTNGFFQIPTGFPPGRYLVGATHLKAGGQGQEIELRAGERKALHFELSVPEGAQASNH